LEQYVVRRGLSVVVRIQRRRVLRLGDLDVALFPVTDRIVGWLVVCASRERYRRARGSVREVRSTTKVIAVSICHMTGYVRAYKYPPADTTSIVAAH